MNILVGIYNISAILGIGVLLIFLALTLYSYNSTKDKAKKRHYSIAIIIELLLIAFLIYMLMYASKRTKEILGGLDVVSMFS